MPKWPWKRGKLPAKPHGPGAGKPAAPLSIRPEFSEKAVQDVLSMRDSALRAARQTGDPRQIEAAMKRWSPPAAEAAINPKENLVVAGVLEERLNRSGWLPNDPDLVSFIEHKMAAYRTIREAKIEGLVKGNIPQQIAREINPRFAEINKYASQMEMQANAERQRGDAKAANEIWEQHFRYEKEFVVPAAIAALAFPQLESMKGRYDQMRDQALAKKQEAQKNAAGWRQNAQAAPNPKARNMAAQNAGHWDGVARGWEARQKDVVERLNTIEKALQGMSKDVTDFRSFRR